MYLPPRTVPSFEAEGFTVTDKALENALAKKNQLVIRKKKLLAEVTDIDDQIGHVDRFIKAWHSFAENDPELPVENIDEQIQNKESASQNLAKKVTNSRKEVVAEAAREIIRGRGAPVGRSELFVELKQRGLTIGGSNPEMVLSTMLWRMRDRIARVKGGGYWLADVPYESVGYNPVMANDMDSVSNTPAGEIADPDTAEAEFDDDQVRKLV